MKYDTIFLNAFTVSLSIVIAIITSAKPISPSENKFLGVRWIRSLIPFIINFAILIFLFIMEIIDNKNINGIDLCKSFFCSFLIILFCSLVAFFIIFRKTEILKDEYDQNELDDYYLKLTESLGDNKIILIIGGDLDFLGEINGENEQYKQLYKAIDEKACKLNILSRKPDFSSTLNGDTRHRLMIGKLLNKFSNRLEIHYYDNACPELPVRGRIITTYENTNMVCRHWKKNNNKYMLPKIYDDTNPEGETILALFKILWDKSTKLSDPEIATLQNEYNIAVTSNT